MRPGGHLATAAALGGVGYMLMGSAELAAGCLAGGFLIDGDHYFDYLTFEGQWRRPGPRTFLRYYFTHRYRWAVLPLHSWELLGFLGLLSLAWPRPAVLGYLSGALLHIVLDILVNGEHMLRHPIYFYSFAYRASQRFSAARLMAPLVIPPEVGQAPVREFFTWRLPETRLHPTKKCVLIGFLLCAAGVYALDTTLALPPRKTKAKVLTAMEGHVLGQAELMGRYKRR